MRWVVKLDGDVAGPMTEEGVVRLLRGGFVGASVRPEGSDAAWRPAAEWKQFAEAARWAVGQTVHLSADAPPGSADSADNAVRASSPRAKGPSGPRDGRLTQEADDLLRAHRDRVTTFVQIAFTKATQVDEYGDPNPETFVLEATKFLKKLAKLDKRLGFVARLTSDQVSRLANGPRPRVQADSFLPNAMQEQHIVAWEVIAKLKSNLDAYAAAQRDAAALAGARHVASPGLSGVEYELQVLAMLRALPVVGSARRIGQAGDCGGDLLFTVGERRAVAQVKHYSGKVGSEAVQEVFAAKANYVCDLAVVISNNVFTLPARRLAKQIGVHLVEPTKPPCANSCGR